MASKGSLLALSLASLIFVPFAHADADAELKAIIADINSSYGDTPLPVRVEKTNDAITSLTNMIDGKRLNDKGKIIAYYHRGAARLRLNILRFQQKQPADVSVARAALADLDRVIENGVDVSGWEGVSPDNAAFLAGLAASNHLKSEPLAYSYWNKCAQRDHAGCMNIMAGARLTGKGNQKVDIKQAIDLHVRVYQTGTRFRCAGGYSAQSVAMISHFTGVKYENEDELTWFRRANELLDKVAAEEGKPDMCNRSGIDINEYMVRLSRGENAASIASRAASRRGATDEDKATVRFLLGEIDNTAFDKVVATVSDSKRCGMHFMAMWLAKLSNDSKRGQMLQRALLETGQERCATELVYAKKFGF